MLLLWCRWYASQLNRLNKYYHRLKHCAFFISSLSLSYFFRSLFSSTFSTSLRAHSLSFWLLSSSTRCSQPTSEWYFLVLSAYYLPTDKTLRTDELSSQRSKKLLRRSPILSRLFSQRRNTGYFRSPDFFAPRPRLLAKEETPVPPYAKNPRMVAAPLSVSHSLSHVAVARLGSALKNPSANTSSLFFAHLPSLLGSWFPTEVRKMAAPLTNSVTAPPLADLTVVVPTSTSSPSPPRVRTAPSRLPRHCFYVGSGDFDDALWNSAASRSF